MKMINKILGILVLVFFLFSCKKEEIKDVDFSNYNNDKAETNTELDQWLRKTFLDEYNIDVVYRYDVYNHDIDRNVTPVYLDRVKPTMTAVLESYLLPYRKVGGEDFIKRYSPKEWVLFGSASLASDGTGVAGTAAGGRRITLYALNTQPANYGVLVIHHEFTHILNQLVAIPTDFESISKSDYNADWSKIPADTAKKYGFVTAYAMGKYTEDYAETAAHLLVKGQAWYDNYMSGSSVLGRDRLKAKETNVVNYFTTGLGVDFRALQKEVVEYMKKTSTGSTLSSYLLPTYLSKTYKTVTINMNSLIYNKYGTSSAFMTAYNDLKAGIAATNRTLNSFSLRFDSSTQLTVRVNYTSGGSVFDADYTFSYTLNSSTGELVLTKANQAGTTGAYANANNIMSAFNASLLPYFSGKVFTASWLKADVDAADYNYTGAFYEKGNEANYWYGTLGL